MTEIQFILVLLALFGIKHFFCDFVFQSDSMVRSKGTYGADGGLNHATVHVIGTICVLVPFFVLLPDLRYIAVLMALVDGIIHYHIDWAKHQLSRGLTVADKRFWIWFGLDQCLHYLTYVCLIGWALSVVYNKQML